MEDIFTQRLVISHLVLFGCSGRTSAYKFIVESRQPSVFEYSVTSSIQSKVKVNGSSASPSVLFSRTPRAASTSPQVSPSLIMPRIQRKIYKCGDALSGPSGASLGVVQSK